MLSNEYSDFKPLITSTRTFSPPVFISPSPSYYIYVYFCLIISLSYYLSVLISLCLIISLFYQFFVLLSLSLSLSICLTNSLASSIPPLFQSPSLYLTHTLFPRICICICICISIYTFPFQFAHLLRSNMLCPSQKRPALKK